MNTHSDHNLDQAFSAFLKAEMNKLPPAPVAASPRIANPRPADGSAHARHVLAASVAIFLGGCWMLSGAFEAADPGPANSTPAANMLGGATANEKGVLPAIRKEKAKGDNPAEPIDLP